MSESNNNIKASLESFNIKESKEDNINEKILCPYCLRSSTNSNRCLGICVADSDY